VDIAVMRLEPAIVDDTYGKLNAAGNRFFKHMLDQIIPVSIAYRDGLCQRKNMRHDDI